MYSEGYDCDRKGCKSHTGALEQRNPDVIIPAKYPYKDDTWIRRNTIENGVLVERDFCSVECEAIFCDEQLKEKMKGVAK